VVQQENGVKTAINAIYRDLEYARSLVKARAALQHQQQQQASSSATAGLTTVDLIDEGGDIEESWTFIGDESDPELQRRLAELDVINAAASAGGNAPVTRGRAPRVSLGLEREKVKLGSMQGVEPVKAKTAARR
jgi:hypothetical protein